MVSGMVDVGEQTGALPDMLMKIADTSDEEVDNAVSAMTSLLEPVMIIFLAVVVGSIVIAMFLPLIAIMGDGGSVAAGLAEVLNKISKHSGSFVCICILAFCRTVPLPKFCSTRKKGLNTLFIVRKMMPPFYDPHPLTQIHG